MMIRDSGLLFGATLYIHGSMHKPLASRSRRQMHRRQGRWIGRVSWGLGPSGGSVV